MSTNTRTKCYVAGALTHVEADKGLLHLYERVAEICSSSGFDVYLPHVAKQEAITHAEELTPKKIFDWDAAQLQSSDIVVAFVGVPSLGVGIELGMAACLGIPIVTFCRRDVTVSPMVLGHPSLQQHLFYDCESDCLNNLTQALSGIKDLSSPQLSR